MTVDGEPERVGVAIVDGDRRFTRAEWERRAAALASGLAARHRVGGGDRVAIKMHNRAEFFEVTSALATLGATPVAVGYSLSPPEVERIRVDSGARLVITDDERLDGVHLGREYEELLEAHADGPGPFSPPTGAPESIAYTPGTTGRPRGAVRRFDAAKLAALGEPLGAMFSKLRFAPGGVHLMTCPNYHVAPPFYANYTLATGGRVVIQRHFDAEQALALIDAEGVGTTFMVPTMLNRIVGLPEEVRARYDLGSLRTVVVGGAPFPVGLKRRAIELLGDDVVFDVYTSTETGNVTLLEPADHERKPASVGRPLPGVRLRIVGDDGQPLPPGERGAIFVSSPLLADGCERDPEGAATSPRDGYLTAGDIGYVDDEGYLYVVDRAKDRIVSGGAHVYPAEVEAVLREHPGVFDVAVIGMPDGDAGARVHAVLEERPGARVDDDELLALCRERLAEHEWPRGFERVDELPRNPLGKVLKRELRPERREPAGREA